MADSQADNQKRLEIKVGIFVFIGLAIIAVMAVQFGQIGQGIAKFYPLTVHFPNANGLVKNAEVQLAGAKIGVVAEAPALRPGVVGSVAVLLNIREEIAIPKGSAFSISSSGLLGDKFVVVTVPGNFRQADFDAKDPAQVIARGAELPGSEPGGISAIADKGEAAMAKIESAIDEAQKTLQTIRTEVLSPENIKNLSDALASVKKSADNLEGLLSGENAANLRATLSNAKTTTENLSKTSAELEKSVVVDVKAVVAQLREVAQKGEAVLTSGEQVLKAAQHGNGPLPMLLNNRETADNLRALIDNLRKHGVVFYRDSAAKEAAKEAEKSGEKKRKK